MDAPKLMIIQDLSDERWLSFIRANSQSIFFHHPAWINLISTCYGYRPFIITICDENGEIVAGLPVMEILSILKTKRWVSLPFTDFCNPLYRDKDCLNDLVDEMVIYFSEKHLSRIEVRWELPENPAMHMYAQYAQYALHTLKLEADFERVASRFERTHQQNVRQAEKNQIRIEWGNQLADVRKYYSLQLETRQRHGIPSQPWRYFRLISEQLIEKGFGSVLLAYHGDKYIAGLILLKWQETLSCKYAASREEYMKLRPNNLLFWTAIQWGCRNGFTLFDMGRTDLDNPGLRRFKKGWGADEMPLNYFTISRTPPQLISGNLMKIMKPIIQKSPRWVCQLTGELLYKYFG
jgi:hypothetical protein